MEETPDEYLSELLNDIKKGEEKRDEYLRLWSGAKTDVEKLCIARDHYIKHLKRQRGEVGAAEEDDKSLATRREKGLRRQGRTRDVFQLFYDHSFIGGLTLADAAKITGYKPEEIHHVIKRFTTGGFFTQNENCFSLSTLGASLVEMSKQYEGSFPSKKMQQITTATSSQNETVAAVHSNNQGGSNAATIVEA